MIKQIELFNTYINQSTGANPINDRDTEYSELKAKWDNLNYEMQGLRQQKDQLLSSNLQYESKLAECYTQIDEIFTKSESLKVDYLTCKQVIVSQNDTIYNLCELRSSYKTQIDNLKSKSELMENKIEGLNEKIAKLQEVCELHKDQEARWKEMYDATKQSEQAKDQRIREAEENTKKISDELINWK